MQHVAKGQQATSLVGREYYTFMSSAGKLVPGRLYSLREIVMLNIEAGRLIESISGIASFVTVLNIDHRNGDTSDVDPESFRKLVAAIELLRETGDKLGIIGVKPAADYLLSKLPLIPIRDGKHIFDQAEYFMLKETFNSLLSSMNYGLDTLQCVILSGAESALFAQNDYPFDENVFNNFSSANEDISEAAKCLALRRGTACVMHLMRALEAPLAAFAAELGITKQNDWGSNIRLISEELAKRSKLSNAAAAGQEFLDEAAMDYATMKRAWRNPSMHLDRSYSPERAHEIYNAVKSFMRHLATRLSE